MIMQFAWRASIFAILVVGGTATACAQSSPQDGPVANLANRLKFTTTPPESKDFVKASRQPVGSLNYVPLTAPRPEPSKPALGADRIRAEEAELDAIRARHDVAAKRRGLSGPLKSVAGEDIKVVVRKPVNCLITCVLDSTVASSVVNTVTPVVNPPSSQP